MEGSPPNAADIWRATQVARLPRWISVRFILHTLFDMIEPCDSYIIAKKATHAFRQRNTWQWGHPTIQSVEIDIAL